MQSLGLFEEDITSLSQEYSAQLFAFVGEKEIVFMRRKRRTRIYLSEPIRSQNRQKCSFRPITFMRLKSMERNSNAHFSTRNSGATHGFTPVHGPNNSQRFNILPEISSLPISPYHNLINLGVTKRKITLNH